MRIEDISAVEEQGPAHETSDAFEIELGVFIPFGHEDGAFRALQRAVGIPGRLTKCCSAKNLEVNHDFAILRLTFVDFKFNPPGENTG